MSTAIETRNVYEIINPSDAYTFVAHDDRVAIAANAVLGEGMYGLRKIGDDDFKSPLCMFGAGIDVYDKPLGMTIQEAWDKWPLEISEALDSVLIGSAADRATFESAVSKMSAADAAAFADEWHDQKRSSMNNIGKRAKQLAAAFREKGPTQ